MVPLLEARELVSDIIALRCSVSRGNRRPGLDDEELRTFIASFLSLVSPCSADFALLHARMLTHTHARTPIQYGCVRVGTPCLLVTNAKFNI